MLDPDKASGADGLSNRMIQHTGPIFRLLLFDLLSMIWIGDAQPSTWQNSLLQPILKKGKPTPDPASYRGIYLNVILAKLFEGILIARSMPKLLR